MQEPEKFIGQPARFESQREKLDGKWSSWEFQTKGVGRSDVKA